MSQRDYSHQELRRGRRPTRGDRPDKDWPTSYADRRPEDDPLGWAKLESYRQNYWASNGEDQFMPQVRGASPDSWERDEHNQSVTRALRSNNPDYDIYGDQSYESPFDSQRGKGPKNYQLSDQRIWETLSDRLMEDPHVDATDIEVEVRDGVVRLSGRVWNRPMKHRAEDIAAECPGVRDVDNQLRVTPQ